MVSLTSSIQKNGNWTFPSNNPNYWILWQWIAFKKICCEAGCTHGRKNTDMGQLEITWRNIFLSHQRILWTKYRRLCKWPMTSARFALKFRSLGTGAILKEQTFLQKWRILSLFSTVRCSILHPTRIPSICPSVHLYHGATSVPDERWEVFNIFEGQRYVPDNVALGWVKTKNVATFPGGIHEFLTELITPSVLDANMFYGFKSLVILINPLKLAAVLDSWHYRTEMFKL